jgi:hypothetical protein
MRMNRHQINAMMSDTSLQTLTPQESAKLLITAVRRKARDRGLDDTLTFDQVVAMCELTHCPSTGIKFDMRRGIWLPNRQSLDRIDNTQGYHEHNVRVVTNIFNQSKSAFPDEFHDQMCLGRANVLSR